MRDRNRSLALLLVLLAHVAALYVVQHALRPHSDAQRGTATPSLLVTFLTLPLIPAPSQESPASPSLARRRRERPAPAQRQPAVEPAPAPPAPSTAITDWRAEGAAAARDIASGPGRQGRPFGHEFAPDPERAETGVFGPRNPHPAGTVEDLGGVERHWVTDSCYFDFPRHEEPQLIAGPRVRPMFCKPPPGGGTDVFKKLTPGYLTPPQSASEKR
jgi:hypothetical protein